METDCLVSGPAEGWEFTIPRRVCELEGVVTRDKKVPFSLHLLQRLLFVDFFDDRHSDWCELILHCSFDLQFSNNL